LGEVNGDEPIVVRNDEPPSGKLAALRVDNPDAEHDEMLLKAHPGARGGRRRTHGRPQTRRHARMTALPGVAARQTV
jgi:hypothetical protein